MSPVSLCSRLPLETEKKRPPAEPFNNSKELKAGQRLRSQKFQTKPGRWFVLAICCGPRLHFRGKCDFSADHVEDFFGEPWGN